MKVLILFIRKSTDSTCTSEISSYTVYDIECACEELKFHSLPEAAYFHYCMSFILKPFFYLRCFFFSPLGCIYCEGWGICVGELIKAHISIAL